MVSSSLRKSTVTLGQGIVLYRTDLLPLAGTVSPKRPELHWVRSASHYCPMLITFIVSVRCLFSAFPEVFALPVLGINVSCKG